MYIIRGLRKCKQLNSNNNEYNSNSIKYSNTESTQNNNNQTVSFKSKKSIISISRKRKEKDIYSELDIQQKSRLLKSSRLNERKSIGSRTSENKSIGCRLSSSALIENRSILSRLSSGSLINKTVNHRKSSSFNFTNGNQTLNNNLKLKRRQTISICLISLFFFFCVIPIKLFQVFKFVVNIENLEITHTIFLISKLLFYTHIMSNPIVYNLMSSKFSRSFRKILFCKQF